MEPLIQRLLQTGVPAILERLRVLKPGLKLCTAEDRLRAQLQSPLACDGQRAAERYTDVEFLTLTFTG